MPEFSNADKSFEECLIRISKQSLLMGIVQKVYRFCTGRMVSVIINYNSRMKLPVFFLNARELCFFIWFIVIQHITFKVRYSN